MNEEPPDKAMRRGRLKNGNPGGDLSKAPRCGAKTRAGTPCQQAAMRGKRRCRMHGGGSTGPRTPEGMARMRASKIKHGLKTKEAKELRKLIRELDRLCKPMAREERDS
ncbi:HGGxSTG domain-containing protein [Sediminicoccus rosea]|uniref:HGGxSTG domain-containing protein n=1 Tax=Sediminicoccus rosea TaxID=1225128 RepID=A0ABZ0PL11_9PROT|nr:HGGxSTG domain-containing protein [Sediminicoccus rosea]WPB86419.1 HGGxSTG domain-containing protein [Sediminicoccus rosea]